VLPSQHHQRIGELIAPLLRQRIIGSAPLFLRSLRKAILFDELAQAPADHRSRQPGSQHEIIEAVRAEKSLFHDEQHGHVADDVQRAPDRAGPDGAIMSQSLSIPCLARSP
jgi:hypothetical protein